MLLGRFQAEGEGERRKLNSSTKTGDAERKRKYLVALNTGETSFKDKELRQASELQLRDRGGRQPLAIRQKE